jgi:cation diffusion facilitator CzcD-associated flavoprotein CzcO
MKYLIIGAGPVGLGTARVLKSKGIDYEQAEADDEVGGNWHHGVYRTAHIVACKQVMEFTEFPMPDDYPDFPSQPQIKAYLVNYCDHFKLREQIMFQKKVIRVLPVKNNLWKVQFADGDEKLYLGVLVCTGHHWSKKHPSYPGLFTGEYFHAKDYRCPSQLAGKKILVIGAGNSGCDIVCEAARVGQGAFLSMRRSIWIFPKSFMGKPLGKIQLPRLPDFIQKTLLRMLIRLTFGTHAQYNLPKPEYDFFERHPTVSEELPYYLRHGRVKIKPDIKCFEGNEVVFTDGSRESFDLIVAATGYHLHFPFLPEELVRKENSFLKVYGYAAYEDYKGLFLIGWQQVRGGVGSLISRYAEVIANFIAIEQNWPVSIGAVLKEMGEEAADTHLMGSKDFFRWMDKMNRERLEKEASKMQRHYSGIFRQINKPIGNFETDPAMVVF